MEEDLDPLSDVADRRGREDVRLDVGTGDGRTGPGPDGGLRPEACDGLGRSGRRDVDADVEAGWPRGATSSSTSAGGPPDPPGGAARGGRPGGEEPPKRAASRPR